MFEDVFLTCGKHLYDDDQVYCSDDCQNLDTSSPSISSASSAVSSPNLGFATGGDVPPLVPSALGTALTSAAFHRRRHQYSVSSSSASSTSWSIMTDEDEDIDDFAGIGSYGSNFHSSVDSFHEGISKSASGVDPQKSSAALFYTRRPSGTNNHSTLSGLHNRNSSGHVPHAPRSAPLHSHLGIDEDLYSDVSFSSKEESDSEIYPPKSAMKNKRNRASLPGCFSLLQANPSEHRRMASQTSSSGHTVTTQRKTPPTPKLPLLNALSNLTLSSPTSLTTPRGRRRIQGESSSSRRSDSSSSRSPSRSRWPSAQLSPFRAREDSDVQLSGRFHVTSEAPRGRATHRRNSSPPPKMTVASFDKHRFGSGEARGRQRVGDDLHAPGYGHGRSGLVDRERALGGRMTRVL